ncbi:MAG TPA: MarR family winged helix-turn-helix transcriptional regulator [Usitatibacter sp.]|jgi:MarR family transcriptional regulator, organic hydroperoxide resistance regulator|nr:MarR family winged helix-turn-helix transcriptional regulator [Usitatibacter sp.]
MPLKAARARKAAAEPPLMLDVLKQFRVLLRAMESHYRQVERRSGLGGAQLWALAEIAAADLTMGDLAARLAIHVSTASNLVRRLEELGLATRTRTRADQRVVRIAATAAGRRKLRLAPKPSVGLLQKVLMETPPERLAVLHKELGRLVRRMGRIEPGAATSLISEMIAARSREG